MLQGQRWRRTLHNLCAIRFCINIMQAERTLQNCQQATRQIIITFFQVSVEHWTPVAQRRAANLTSNRLGWSTRVPTFEDLQIGHLSITIVLIRVLLTLNIGLCMPGSSCRKDCTVHTRTSISAGAGLSSPADVSHTPCK